MTNKIKISIIIPIFNLEAYLPKCLDSVLGQNLKEIEVLCINDGSTDNSLKILKKYQKKDSRIQIFSQNNKGQGFSRNLGLMKAKGEYVLFVDGDDWLETEDDCQKLYQQAQENQLDIILFKIKGFDQNSGEIYEDEFFEPGLFDSSQEWEEFFNQKNIKNKENVFLRALSASNKLYRKNFLLENEIKFPENIIFEDAYFGIITILSADRISINQEVNYIYRVNRPESTMQQKVYSRSIFDIFIMSSFVEQFLKNNQLFDVYKIPFIKFLLSQLGVYFMTTNGEMSTEFSRKMTKLIDGYELNEKEVSELEEMGETYQIIVAKNNPSKTMIDLLRVEILKNKEKQRSLGLKLKELEDEKIDLNNELYQIRTSRTWRYGVLMGTIIKDPRQIPAILKRIIVKIFKKILPAGSRTKLKKFIGKHPFLFNPRLAIHYRKNMNTLASILKEEKYKGIIVYPPTIDWDMPLFQRPQQLALAFADAGFLFFYGTANLNHDNVHGFKKIQDNLYVTDQIELLKKVEKTTLFISWSINKYFVEKFPKSKLIYDYIDELDVFDAAGSTAREMIENHKYLVRHADLVVCTADKLLEDVKLLKPKRTILAPNAVTLSHFSGQVRSIPKDISEIVRSGKKIIGYYGAIAEWFDYDLLEKVAELRPDYEFLMIGPLDYDKTLHDHKHLFEIKNIHFVGPKKFSDLPIYLHYFDVATIPFLVNKITESTSPVKLFEYMAGGRPIVTTAMHECKKYKSVLIGTDAEDFVIKLDQAITLENDNTYKNQLRLDAEDNTWSKRAKEIADKVWG